MAQIIKLKYAATCADCGSELEAGSRARWFGRGNVSCCGTGKPTEKAPSPKAAPTTDNSVPDGWPPGEGPHLESLGGQLLEGAVFRRIDLEKKINVLLAERADLDLLITQIAEEMRS